MSEEIVEGCFREVPQNTPMGDGMLKKATWIPCPEANKDIDIKDIFDRIGERVRLVAAASYRNIMKYLHAKYHTFASNLVDLPFSEADKALISHYDAYAQDMQPEIEQHIEANPDVPLGRLIC